MNNWSIKGKRALVTGGSKGIGRAVVQELLDLDAEVLFTARNERELKEAEHQFGNRHNKVHTLAGDINDAGHRSKLADWIADNWGTLDVLVNNAGVNIRKPSAAYSVEEYNRVLGINLIAPFELCRLLYVPLKKSGKGSVINIASVAGSFDAQTGAPYGMSKAGLLQLTRNLAKEWAKDNIRVNSVSPWFTQTPLTRGLLSDPERLLSIVSRTPLARVGQDAEIAAAVAFFAMDKSSYITGQNLSVDGGATISIL